MLTINDLPVAKELSTGEMGAVRGGLCVDVASSVKRGFEEGGVGGAIGALAVCFQMYNNGTPVCPA